MNREIDRFIEHDRNIARLALSLIASGEPSLVSHGRDLRRLALRSIQRTRRQWHRCERRMLMEFGYCDLGEAGA